MDTPLTENAVSTLMAAATDIQPTLQVLSLELVISNKATSSHYRISISDGKNRHTTLLPSSHNNLASYGDLQTGSIIILRKCTRVMLQQFVSLRIDDLEVVQKEAPLVGEPTLFVLPQACTLHVESGLSSAPPNTTAVALPTSSTHPPNASARTIPFKALNPYRKYWCIQGRALAKTPIKEYKTPRGPGKAFGFDLVDHDSTEIHVSAFNDLADSLNELIHIGQVYFLTNGTVKVPNPTYNHLDSPFEILLFAASTVEHCLEDDHTIPLHYFHFKTITSLISTPSDSIVDIIGVVSSTSPTSIIRRRNGTETPRKTITIRDMSSNSIDVTLWGEHCHSEVNNLSELPSSDTLPVLAIKGGRVVEFNGKTIGTISTSTLLINPAIPETLQLQTWFRDIGFNISSPSLSRNYTGVGIRTPKSKTIHEIMTMCTSEKATWVSVHATATATNMEDFYFLACPLSFDGMQCMKKVIQKPDGKWHCTKCKGNSIDCDYRYKLRLQLQDDSGCLDDIIAFDEAATELLDLPAKDMLLLSIEPNTIHDIVTNMASRHYLFTLSIKTDVFNGYQRLSTTLVKSEELPHTSGS